MRLPVRPIGPGFEVRPWIHTAEELCSNIEFSGKSTILERHHIKKMYTRGNLSRNIERNIPRMIKNQLLKRNLSSSTFCLREMGLKGNQQESPGGTQKNFPCFSIGFTINSLWLSIFIWLMSQNSYSSNHLRDSQSY